MTLVDEGCCVYKGLIYKCWVWNGMKLNIALDIYMYTEAIETQVFKN